MKERLEYDPEESEPLSSAEERLYAILVPELQEARIDTGLFGDLYNKSAIQLDLAMVRRKKTELARASESGKTQKKRGDLFEAILADQIYSSQWLGQNAAYIASSEYDDHVGGVDGVVEFKEESSHSYVALAVDATKSRRHIKEKFDRIRESITLGKLSRIKYFIAPDGRSRGELRKIPRVVIGADERTMRELSELIFEFRSIQRVLKENKELSAEGKKSLRERFLKIRDRLAHHPFQGKIIEEVVAQLGACAKYAEYAGQTKIVAILEHMLAIFKDIQKERPRPAGESFDDDAVYALIIEEARSLEAPGLVR